MDGGKPANDWENRRDRRLAKNHNGKRRAVVIMRERGGRTPPFVARGWIRIACLYNISFNDI